ncbi:integrase catalytic domain-containing protein [Trichonephila clavipes]|nr:integrase catalytic domain-containing protein [Trichonephila clavipes]
MAKNKSDLSSLYDKLQTQIRALDSLGLIKDKYADILFPLIESALPVDIVKLWERQRHLSTDKNQSKTDLDLLMEFIKNEVDSKFRVKISREIFHPDKVNNKKNINQYSEYKAVVSTACEFLTANDNSKSFDNSRKFKKFDKCIFCDKLHAYESCNEVSNMKGGHHSGAQRVNPEFRDGYNFRIIHEQYFSGVENVVKFLENMDNNLTYYEIPTQLACAYLKGHLTGRALDWFEVIGYRVVEDKATD